jgi:hypothetical protein
VCAYPVGWQGGPLDVGAAGAVVPFSVSNLVFYFTRCVAGPGIASPPHLNLRVSRPSRMIMTVAAAVT